MEILATTQDAQAAAQRCLELAPRHRGRAGKHLGSGVPYRCSPWGAIRPHLVQEKEVSGVSVLWSAICSRLQHPHHVPPALPVQREEHQKVKRTATKGTKLFKALSGRRQPSPSSLSSAFSPLDLQRQAVQGEVPGHCLHPLTSPLSSLTLFHPLRPSADLPAAKLNRHC